MKLGRVGIMLFLLVGLTLGCGRQRDPYIEGSAPSLPVIKPIGGGAPEQPKPQPGVLDLKPSS